MLPEMMVYEMNAWDHVVAGIICILAPLLALTSRKITIDDISLESEEKIRLYHSNALLLTVFALVLATSWRIPGRPLEGLGLVWPVWHPYLVPVLITIFMFYFLDIYFQYGTRRRRERTFSQKSRAFAFVPTINKEVIHFVFLAVAAGIGEEIIFRGFLINYILYWTGTGLAGIIVASMVSSGLFAFLHGYQGFQSMAKIFLLSLLFSAVFILSQSLLIVIIVHALIDTISGLISVYLMKTINDET